MTFKRPRVAIRTLIPSVFGAPQIKDFQHDFYTYFSSNIITGVSVSSGGSNYSVNDLLLPKDGEGIFGSLKVTSVDGGGAITGVEVDVGGGGAYTVNPTTPNLVSDSGPGFGASINLTLSKNWVTGGAVSIGAAPGTNDIAVLDSSTLNLPNQGSGYNIGDIITVSGGAGTAATFLVENISGAAPGPVAGLSLRSRGEYTTAPASPAPQGSTTGSGTGVTIEITTGFLDGSYSFKMVPTTQPELLAEKFEINFLNLGSEDTPDESFVQIGINPDGDTVPIPSTVSPHLNVPNFSGNNSGTWGSGGRGSSDGITQTQYAIFDFDDAVLILFYDSGKTAMPRGFHTGYIYEPRFDSDRDGDGGLTDVRLDGLGHLGYKIDSEGQSGTSSAWWYTGGVEALVFSFLRVALGNSVGTDTTNSWLTGQGTASSNTLADYQYGTASDTRTAPAPCRQRGTPRRTQMGYGEYKYLKMAASSLPFTFDTDAGGNQFLIHAENTASAAGLGIHTPAKMSDGKTDGTYL